MQLGRSLPLFLDAHAKRAFEAPSRVDHFLSKLAPDNPLLRCVPHPELTAHHVGGGNDLKIIHRHEVPDFQLSLAHDCQGRRLYPANPDHTPRPSAQSDRRGSGQRQVVDLVGLPARDCGGVKAGISELGFALANASRIVCESWAVNSTRMIWPRYW